jgi:hypothetical protein
MTKKKKDQNKQGRGMLNSATIEKRGTQRKQRGHGKASWKGLTKTCESASEKTTNKQTNKQKNHRRKLINK